MKNIILIGMPGAGKSTVGVVLAKRLGYQFIDTDLVIQSRENKLLHEIITEYGVEKFNEIENNVNASITAERAVIATGGSAVYGKEGMEHLKEIGCVIYLKLSYHAIKRRLGDLKKRGVTLKKGQSLYGLYEERIPLYEKYADITINCEKKMIKRVVSEIVKVYTG